MDGVSVIGLGKLGACMAAAFASRGFSVIGVDAHPQAVDLINQGRAPVEEPDLQETITAHKARLRATRCHTEAIHESALTFVIVPTPSDQQGFFSLTEVARAFQQIGTALADKKDYHLVVLTSTVLPGATRYGLLPILEAASKKKCGRDFGLCYSPAFIALGSVIKDFLNPDFTLIGEFDDKAGMRLELCYAELMKNKPACQRMSLENAELTKIALNAFVTTKITFANMLASLCERIPGGDVDTVTNALGCDTRIGPRYLKGGLGYGGPCFPRDNLALISLSAALKIPGEISEATDRTNRRIPSQAADGLRPYLQKGSTVAVLGLTYKPFSHVIEESQSIQLINELMKAEANIIAYDPLIKPGDLNDVPNGIKIKIATSLEECVAHADVVVVTTPAHLFKDLKVELINGGKPATVIDFWRLLSPAIENSTNIRYIPVGRSSHDVENASRMTLLWKCVDQYVEPRD
jgi:UDPglucose 6-dehydrogenase